MGDFVQVLLKLRKRMELLSHTALFDMNVTLNMWNVFSSR